MKTKIGQITRIASAAVFFASGAIILFESVWGATTRFNGDWWFLLSVVTFTLIFCGVFFTSGHLLLRRRYRKFTSIWVILAAFGAFGFIIGLPDRAQEALRLANTDWRLGLLRIASLFAGVYAARWFIRSAFRLLDRLLPREHGNSASMAYRT